MAPLRRNLDADQVGSMGMVMLSKLSSAITGEVVHVDCGFSIMGYATTRLFGHRRCGKVNSECIRASQSSAKRQRAIPFPRSHGKSLRNFSREESD